DTYKQDVSALLGIARAIQDQYTAYWAAELGSEAQRQPLLDAVASARKAIAAAQAEQQRAIVTAAATQDTVAQLMASLQAQERVLLDADAAFRDAVAAQAHC